MTANLKKAEKVDKIFFAKKGLGGGGNGRKRDVTEYRGFIMVAISTAIGLAQDISVQVLTIWGRLLKGRMTLIQSFNGQFIFLPIDF